MNWKKVTTCLLGGVMAIGISAQGVMAASVHFDQNIPSHGQRRSDYVQKTSGHQAIFEVWHFGKPHDAKIVTWVEGHTDKERYTSKVDFNNNGTVRMTYNGDPAAQIGKYFELVAKTSPGTWKDCDVYGRFTP